MKNKNKYFGHMPSSMKTMLVVLGLVGFSVIDITEASAQMFGSNRNRNRTEVDARNRPSFGVKAGINRSNVWDEQGQDFQADAKTGFVGGAFISLPITTFLGIQPEILISQKGFQGSGTLLTIPYTFSRTTTYLDVPLLVQIKPVEAFTVVFGPQYAYLLSERNTYSFGGNNTVLQEEFDNDNIRKNTMGFVVGADFNADHVVISARAGWDFLNNNGDGTSTTPRYKNQWLQLTLGFKL
jgi:hypothetical protein